MNSEQPRSVYVHVPFCVHRCGYCDFTLLAGRDDLASDYLLAIERELETVAGRPQVETVFLGGGTPTQLTAPQLSKLMQLLHDRFDWATDGEFSVEANPVGLTDEKLAVLQDAGVNRISLGLQSFDAGVLATLERDHRFDDILDCVQRTQRRFQNVGFDLIFAVPGQSFELWQQTLQTAIGLSPTHLSTYGLTFEKGTAFWSRREKGQLDQAADELERAMYAASMDDLGAAGFEQYEISNFARPGFRCRHNQVYWFCKPYWGFGPGAARLLNGTRIMNHRSTTTWIKRVLAGESTIFETETLSPEDQARELLVLGLRMNDGVSRSEFASRSAFDLDALAGDALQRLQAKGLISDDGERVQLTREGRFLADYVVGGLL